MSLPASLSAFATLPDDARLWLVAFDRPVEAAQLAPEVEALLGRWRHKGVAYHGAWTLLEDRILAIAEPTLAVQPSGCAIDGMLRGVRRTAPWHRHVRHGWTRARHSSSRSERVWSRSISGSHPVALLRRA